MKKIYLLRHAKSSWDNPELDDFERPLNKRGRRDIPVMAKIINKVADKPELIISSPALRAAYTARTICENAGFSEEILKFDLMIYEASASGLLRLIKNQDSAINHIMLVGHNPGFTQLANYLSDKRVDNIPTCGLFGMELDLDQWQKVDGHCARFLLFEYPKKYQ